MFLPLKADTTWVDFQPCTFKYAPEGHNSMQKRAGKSRNGMKGLENTLRLGA